MKHSFILILLLIGTSVFAQSRSKKASTNQKSQQSYTHIKSDNGQISTKGNSFQIEFGQKGKKFTKENYVFTKDGQKLKIGDEFSASFTSTSEPSSSGQPTAQGGPVASVDVDTSLSPDGSTVTITITTASDDGQGNVKTSKQTTEINTATGASRTVTVTHSENSGNGNVDVEVD